MNGACGAWDAAQQESGQHSTALCRDSYAPVWIRNQHIALPNGRCTSAVLPFPMGFINEFGTLTPPGLIATAPLSVHISYHVRKYLSSIIFILGQKIAHTGSICKSAHGCAEIFCCYAVLFLHVCAYSPIAYRVPHIAYREE